MGNTALTADERISVVQLLRAAVVESETGNWIIPIRVAALASGLWKSRISALAHDAARAVVVERCGPDAKPDRREYPAMLRRAALNVEEGSWP